MKVRTRLAIALLSTVTGLACADSARAQAKPDQLPVVPAPKNFTEVKKEAGPLSQASKDTVKAEVEFRMGSMTEGKTSPEKARIDLDGDLRAIASEDGLALANKTALELAGKVVRGRAFLPAARINAMLAIAELSEGPANARVPYNGALPELYKIAIDSALPCYLRSVALVGIDRHARSGKTLNDAQGATLRNTFAGEMVKIIGSQPASIKEEEAHWWMVRRAYDVLYVLQTKEPLSPAMKNAVVQAMDQFNDPTQLTSIRYAAGTFLTRYDFAAMKPAFRMKLFLGVAQFLDQEVVGWYENENDKTKMQSSGMGSFGGMGMGDGMGMGMGMGMDGGASGGADVGGMGSYGSMMGDGRGASNSKPIDTQPWDLRIARRKLNTYTQLGHALLKGTLTKDERDYHPAGKGIMEAALPASHARAGKFILEGLEATQDTINDKALTSVSSMMTRLITPLTQLRDGAELIPAYQEPDPADKEKMIDIVKSFKDYSPRMKSFKKADASGKLESATPAPPKGAAGEKPADGDQPAAGDKPADGAAGAPAPAPGGAPAPAPAAGGAAAGAAPAP